MDGGSEIIEDRPVVADEAQALIEQARRRQRRRYRWFAIMIIVAIGGTAIGFGVASGGGKPAVRHGSTAPITQTGSGTQAVVLNRPEALAVAADGSLLIANRGTNQILRRSAAGNLYVVAGTGTSGYSGDGGSAVRAELNNPGGIAVAANGTIYVADTANNRVRAISPRGVITTLATKGSQAARAGVVQPEAIALGAHGRLYVTDNAGLQVISSNGILVTVVHAGPAEIKVSGTPTAFFPDAIAVDSNGDLYVADFSPKLLIEFSPTGRVLHSWPAYVALAGLSPASDGGVLVADYGFALDRAVGGRLTRIAVGFDRGSLSGLTRTFRPSGVAAASNGDVYTDDDGVSGGTNRADLSLVSPPSGQARLLVIRSASQG